MLGNKPTKLQSPYAARAALKKRAAAIESGARRVRRLEKCINKHIEYSLHHEYFEMPHPTYIARTHKHRIKHTPGPSSEPQAIHDAINASAQDSIIPDQSITHDHSGPEMLVHAVNLFVT